MHCLRYHPHKTPPALRAAATTLELPSSAADAAVAACSLRSAPPFMPATKSCAYAGGLAFVPREFGRAGGGEADEGAAEDAGVRASRVGRAGGGSCDGAAETPLGEHDEAVVHERVDKLHRRRSAAAAAAARIDQRLH